MKKIFLSTLLCIIALGLCITISSNDSLAFYESKALQDGYIPSEGKVMLRSAPSSIDEETFAVIEGIIIDAWSNMEQDIYLSDTGITYDQFYNFVLPRYSELLNENPEYFYVRGAYKYSLEIPYIQIVYNYDLESIPEKIELFNNKVNEIIALIDTNSMNEVDIALAVHDYLVLNAEYDMKTYEDKDTGNRDAFNAYGVLINKIGVCQSYTLAYNYILSKLDIEAYPVTSSELNHIWSMVKIDENYYHVDVTHDDPIIDRLGISKYTYFLCSDQELLSDAKHGTIWSSKYLAESDDYTGAFWKKVNSTVAYLDGKYYAAIPNAKPTEYTLVSANSENPEDTIDLRKSINAVWHITGDDETKYYSGQMYVNVVSDGEYVYYNDTYNILRYCEGFDADEVAFKSGIKYGFVRPLPGIINNTLNFITVEWNDLNDAYVFSEVAAAELSGHNFVENVIDPTETTFGRTETSCGTCNFNKISDITNPLAYLIGDVDGSGAVDSKDTVILSRHLAKWYGYETLTYYFNCDVNNDVNIDSKDIVILSRYLAKWSGYTTLPFTS